MSAIQSIVNTIIALLLFQNNFRHNNLTETKNFGYFLKSTSMKYLFLGLLLPFGSIAQQIAVNEVDRFTKQRIIETSVIPLKSTSTEELALQLRSEGKKIYVVLRGHGRRATTIGTDDKALFLLANDSVLIVHSTGIQSSVIDKNRSVYKYQYSLSPASLEQLARFPLRGIRTYDYNGHNDFDIVDSQADELKNGSLLFYRTLLKEKIILKLIPIELAATLRHIGDSVSISGRVTGVDYAWDGKSKLALLYLGLPHPNQYLTLSIPATTNNFSGISPEEFYINKEISANGIIVLRNNLPQMHIDSKDQLYIKTPVKLDEITNFVGDSVLVYGEVISEVRLKEKEDDLRMLNIGKAYPDQLLTVVIRDASKNNFTEAFDFYEGKVVRIRGRVSLYNGKPGITVSKPDQID